MATRPAILALAFTMACSSTPSPTAIGDPHLARGVSLVLAEARAACVSAVEYDLRFDLRKLDGHVAGRASVTFNLTPGAERERLVLDFAGADLVLERCGERPSAHQPRRVEDHYVLDPGLLVAGRNRLEFRFTAPVAPAGAPLIHYRDSAKAQDFVYTLLVPSDAHRLFPCFDQPDLRGRFRVTLDVPEGWTKIANVDEGFTVPLPTYLFAFAAGPFTCVQKPGFPRIYVRPSRRAELEEVVAVMNQHALDWLQEWFGVPYAFGKLDAVLLPAFPYGGMEHAGAIFYRENALLFDHTPTSSELHRRSTLIYHEVAHQWFGNLVTMRWFDNLWLKEGFATFLAYRALEALEPESKPWLRFLQVVKPAAYAVDATAGTTPVWQELRNLDDAKSNYGPIVYNKAPAVLRELEARIGEGPFRSGVKLFLTRHAFGAARWDDLIGALAEASGRDLSAWSERWILAPGMPRIRVRSKQEDDVVKEFTIVQESTLADGGTWPLRVDLLVVARDGARRELAVTLQGRETPCPDLVGGPPPRAVVLNSRDVAYGEFHLDPASAHFWLEALPDEGSELLRSILCRQLEAGVREGDLDPAAFAECLLRLARKESDPETFAVLSSQLSLAILRWQDPARRKAQLEAFTQIALDVLASDQETKKLATFRTISRASGDARVLALCDRVARGLVPWANGLQDRFSALATLRAAGCERAEAEASLAALTADEAQRLRFLAGAALADAEVKRRYFSEYGKLGTPPEPWAQDSLGFFHWPGQESLTLPFLRPALEQVAWVKANRKIFFLPAWIDAFVNAHASPEALAIVDAFLAANDADLEADVRRKILQSRDGLARAVAIRSKWKAGR